jgi:hypothetical protein
VTETYEQAGEFKEWFAIPFGISSRTKNLHDAAADERFSPAVDQILELIEDAGITSA